MERKFHVRKAYEGVSSSCPVEHLQEHLCIYIEAKTNICFVMIETNILI